MPRYYATFISGLSQPAAECLLAVYPKAKISALLDGGVLFSLPQKPHGDKLPFFGTLFEVKESFRIAKNTRDPLGMMYAQTLLTLRKGMLGQRRGITFRIIASLENKLVPIDRKILDQLESRVTSVCGMVTHRAQPQVELWFLVRSEGLGLFMERLTYHAAYDKILEKGQLRPELAALLVALAKPQENETLLDPFAGTGAIPLAARRYPIRIIAADENREMISLMKKRMGGDTSVTIQHGDARELTLKDESVDIIVTDPPWGNFQKEMDATFLYDAFIKEAKRVLKPDGRLILLTAKRAEAEAAFMAHNIIIHGIYSVLVNGKKAAVYVGVRGNEHARK